MIIIFLPINTHFDKSSINFTCMKHISAQSHVSTGTSHLVLGQLTNTHQYCSATLGNSSILIDTFQRSLMRLLALPIKFLGNSRMLSEVKNTFHHLVRVLPSHKVSNIIIIIIMVSYQKNHWQKNCRGSGQSDFHVKVSCVRTCVSRNIKIGIS